MLSSQVGTYVDAVPLQNYLHLDLPPFSLSPLSAAINSCPKGIHSQVVRHLVVEYNPNKNPPWVGHWVGLGWGWDGRT